MTSTTTNRAADWYTMESAATEIGVSTKTVRRWTHDITSNPKHPLRKHFKPSPAKVREFKEQKNAFTWEFNGIVLDTIVTERQGKSRRANSTAGESSASGSRDLVDYLKKENAELKDQLNSEREHNRSIQREQIKLQQAHSITQSQTNALLQQLTTSLQLDKPASSANVSTVDTEGATPQSKTSRLRSILTKEIHLPFVSRLVGTNNSSDQSVR